MNIRLFFLLFLLISYMVGWAQQIPTPGGVAGVVIWYASEQSSSGAQRWVNQISGESNFPSHIDNAQESPGRLLNFNPALSFSTLKNEILLNTGLRDFSKSTFFTVIHPSDLRTEKLIWSFEKNLKSELALTTHRMADIASIKYMNFLQNDRAIPKINTYTQFKDKEKLSSFSSQMLRIGGKCIAPDLPVTYFSGLIPEIIVYDRVLNDQERLQVESYLALKYGITLSLQGENSYLNSDGIVIWDGVRNHLFSNNIVGIGRDDHSLLYQKQSSSAYSPGLLVLGAGQISEENTANPAVFLNKSFLIWGDNNGELEFEAKEQGQPAHLYRKWVMSAHHQASDIATMLKFAPRQTDAKLKNGEVWWLTIDESGTGMFPLGQVSYHKGIAATGKKDIVFDGIHWDADKSGYDLFTFSAGPEMMATFWITEPVCNPHINGKLHIGAEGGVLPYKFVLKGAETSFNIQWESITKEIRIIENVAPGDYNLTVWDAEGKVYNETLYIQSADAPIPLLNAKYQIKPGQTLRLDASENIGPDMLTYQWIRPDGTQSFSPKIEITNPGIYQLILDKSGCISRQYIEVSEYQSDVFEQILLYPNPAHDGYFQLKVKLYRGADVNFEISDISGRLLFTKALHGNDRYTYDGWLPGPGSYVLTMRSEGTVKSLQLIVN